MKFPSAAHTAPTPLRWTTGGLVPWSASHLFQGVTSVLFSLDTRSCPERRRDWAALTRVGDKFKLRGTHGR